VGGPQKQGITDTKRIRHGRENIKTKGIEDVPRSTVPDQEWDWRWKKVQDDPTTAKKSSGISTVGNDPTQMTEKFVWAINRAGVIGTNKQKISTIKNRHSRKCGTQRSKKNEEKASAPPFGT